MATGKMPVLRERETPGGNSLKTSLIYRIASCLLLLFAVGHTLGFRNVDPQWRADSVVESMQTFHFDVQGFSRSYWDFFTGAGFFVGAFLLFAAVLAWQLGGLKKEMLTLIPLVTWGLAICFLGVTVLSWKYFFIVPVIFSSVITLCLLLAAWLARKTS